MWDLITTVIAAIVGGVIAAATPRVRRAFDLIGKREGRLMTTVEWNLKVLAELPEGPGRETVQADTDRALAEMGEIRQASIPKRSVDPKERRNQLRRDALSNPSTRWAMVGAIVACVGILISAYALVNPY